MTRMCQFVISAIFVASTAVFSLTAQADIVLSGTRIIYNADQKDVTLRMENKGARPLLVQTWIDTGSENADPSTLKVPLP